MNIIKNIKEELKEWKILITQERNSNLACKEFKKHGYVYGDYLNKIPSSLEFNDGNEGNGAPQYFYTSPCSALKKENGSPVVDYEKSSDTYFIALQNGEKLYITKNQKMAIERAKENWVRYCKNNQLSR